MSTGPSVISHLDSAQTRSIFSVSAARHRNSSVQFQTLRIGYVLHDKHQAPVPLRPTSPSLPKGHFRTRFWNPQSLSEEATDGGVSRPAPRVRPHRVIKPSPFQVFLMNPEPATVLGVRWRPDFGALRGVNFREYWSVGS